jgi:guanine deaminase
MKNDKSLLHRAVEIAGEGIENGGGPFGAVIAKDGKILGESFNKVVLMNDETAHAEILAIRQASATIGSYNLNECTLYASCEPCPMCLGAIYWAGIKKVVYSSDRTDAAKAGFNDLFIYNEISLLPSKRGITFLQLKTTGSKKVLRKWKRSENKIPY